MSEFGEKIDQIREQRIFDSTEFISNQVNLVELAKLEDEKKANLIRVAGIIAVRATEAQITKTNFRIYEETKNYSLMKKNMSYRNKYKTLVKTSRNLKDEFSGWKISVNNNSYGSYEDNLSFVDGNLLSIDGRIGYYNFGGNIEESKNNISLIYTKYDGTEDFDRFKHDPPISWTDYRYGIDRVENALMSFVLDNNISSEGL